MRDEDVPVLRDEEIFSVVDSGYGLREPVQHWNNAFAEFGQASRQNLNTSPSTTGQASVVDDYKPASTARDLQVHW